MAEKVEALAPYTDAELEGLREQVAEYPVFWGIRKPEVPRLLATVAALKERLCPHRLSACVVCLDIKAHPEKYGGHYHGPALNPVLYDDCYSAPCFCENPPNVS